MSSIIQNNQVFNNEVPFCRVYSMESKKQLEERFLAHRISYFIEWQDKSILQRIFDRNGGKIVCTFRINKGDIIKAKELCQGIEGIKFKDLGEIKNTERIRRRSEAARPEDIGMDVPSLRFETKLNGSMGIQMASSDNESSSEQYEDQYEQQYDQYGSYEEGYEEGYEDGYEDEYYEEGYEDGYEEEYYEEGYDDGYQGYDQGYQTNGQQGYDQGYEQSYQGYGQGVQNFSLGYDQDYQTNGQQGYDQGYQTNGQQGYDQGYQTNGQQGYDQGYQTNGQQGYVQGYQTNGQGYGDGYTDGNGYQNYGNYGDYNQ